MPSTSRLLRSARRSRPYLAALAAAVPVLALASAQALTGPAAPDGMSPDGQEARAGASGLAGSGSGGAAGSGWDGLGGGGSGGRAGSSGRDGARPLDTSSDSTPLDDTPDDTAPDNTAPDSIRQYDTHSAPAAIPAAGYQLPTTLRRGVQMGNGSVQALDDQAGSFAVPAPAADLMVTANGSCGDEADQVGVARNPRDRAP